MENVKSFFDEKKIVIIVVIVALILGSITTVFLLTRDKTLKMYYLCRNDEVGTYVEFTPEYVKMVGESKYITLTQPPTSFWDKYDDINDSELRSEIVNNYIEEVKSGGVCGGISATTKTPSEKNYNT